MGPGAPPLSPETVSAILVAVTFTATITTANLGPASSHFPSSCPSHEPDCPRFVYMLGDKVSCSAHTLPPGLSSLLTCMFIVL